MSSYVKELKATGVYGRFDLQQEFEPGVNILHGKNGTGKTTLLHILANVLNGDYSRFAFIRFDAIQVQLDDGTTIDLLRRRPREDATIVVKINGKQERDFSVKQVQVQELELSNSRSQQRLLEEPTPFKGPLPTSYFPAFRTMIEAWASVGDERGSRARLDVYGAEWPGYRHEQEAQKAKETAFARQLFGEFVPRLNYPSPLEIEHRLSREVQQALLNLARVDRELLSQAFIDIFKALSKESGQVQQGAEIRQASETILDQIKSLSERIEESAPDAAVYGALREQVQSFQVDDESKLTAARVLEVYRHSLDQRAAAREKSFETIERYMESANEFLEGKRITYLKKAPPATRFVGIKFDDGTSTQLRSLSSGERQIVTLIYVATHMSSAQVVLIDEPEISLHVDWQRLLLRKMSQHLGDRQIIACTHSPVIGADYEDRMKELRLVGTSRRHQFSDEMSDADLEASV